jgi:hypothetical protein
MVPTGVSKVFSDYFREFLGKNLITALPNQNECVLFLGAWGK